MDEEQRDFTDRALCDGLQDPMNLRGFLRQVVPDLVDGFDFSRMRPATREFLVGNWRRREPDVFVEIPYRSGDAEQWMIVCVQIEHQTNSDRLIPFRSLLYAVLYWEWQHREWSAKATPRERLEFTPVLPIVLHTGKHGWGSAKAFRDLLAPPADFHAFAPDWRPQFWELAKHDSAELLNGEDAFMQALALFKADDAELEDALTMFREVFRKIDPLNESAPVRWRELLRLILGWAQNRRSKEERETWNEIADDLGTTAERRREIRDMKTTIAQSLIEEGRAIGREEGRAEAEVGGLRKSLLRKATRRFGNPSSAHTSRLEQIADFDELDRMIDLVSTVDSWDALLRE